MESKKKSVSAKLISLLQSAKSNKEEAKNRLIEEKSRIATLSFLINSVYKCNEVDGIWQDICEYYLEIIEMEADARDGHLHGLPTRDPQYYYSLMGRIRAYMDFVLILEDIITSQSNPQ